MLDNELKYLLGGIALLKNDAKIANEMGGESMANAAKLAQLIKNKSKEIDFNDRVENMASDILYHDYAKPGKRGLAPQRINSSFLTAANDGSVRLDYRISGATGAEIDVNRDGGLPGVAARGPIQRGAPGLPGASAAGVIRPRRDPTIFAAF